MMELKPDNVAGWDADLFVKSDGSPDALFYSNARKLVHIDDEAIRSVTALYRELLPPDGAILDLMSSWRSHLPPDAHYSRVAGLGMNREELQDNPQLTEHAIRDLNTGDAHLPYGDREFDGACCTVSAQYLQKPVDVFREVGRVLKPGSPFVVTFSNRCFPTKAIRLWLETGDEDHMQLVKLYFAAAGNWSRISTRDCRSVKARVFRSDPLFAVWAYVQANVSAYAS